MKRVIAAIFALVPLASSATAQAWHIPPTPGVITRAEALTRADRLFDQLDVNHDGSLTLAEAQAAGAKLALARLTTGTDVAPGIGGHTLKYMERALAGRTSVDRKAFEHAMLAHFDDMDANHDGLLTAAERAEGGAALAAR